MIRQTKTLTPECPPGVIEFLRTLMSIFHFNIKELNITCDETKKLATLTVAHRSKITSSEVYFFLNLILLFKVKECDPMCSEYNNLSKKAKRNFYFAFLFIVFSVSASSLLGFGVPPFLVLVIVCVGLVVSSAFLRQGVLQGNKVNDITDKFYQIRQIFENSDKNTEKSKEDVPFRQINLSLLKFLQNNSARGSYTKELDTIINNDKCNKTFKNNQRMTI